MIDLQFKMEAFEQRAREFGAQLDQLPFAISVALNEAAKVARAKIIDDTWPRSVHVRNRSFMRAALRIDFANKNSLAVSVYDSLGRAHLSAHAKGGVKKGKGRIAVPSARVSLTPSGVRKSQRPMALKRAVRKGNLIFQAVGRGKAARLQLMYKLAPSVRIKADVPFYSAFRESMKREVDERLPAAFAKAMATRRR